MKKLMITSLLAVVALPTIVLGQGSGLGEQIEFMDVVKPIMTEGEKQIYDSLPNQDARRYFQQIFWYKRDAEPAKEGNAFRKDFFQRRRVSVQRFAEGSKSGLETDRGQVYLLMGEPEDVAQSRLASASAFERYEEVWAYPAKNINFRFIYDGKNRKYQLEDKARLSRRMESLRDALVLDRAEPYIQATTPLTLPNLGFTKDIENLATPDRSDINFRLSYHFFRGDLNRTEVLVGITFLDISGRGIDLQLAAYDPYEHKVVDFKKRIDIENETFFSFPITIEPDQYQFVLRCLDKDGREAIDRRLVDVPAIGFPTGPSSSSLLVSGGLNQVPLVGFREPKKFVFDHLYFPISNYFKGGFPERLFIMQHFYNYPSEPKPTHFLNMAPAQAKLEHRIQNGDDWRMVWSVPLGSDFKLPGSYRTVLETDNGNLSSKTALFSFSGQAVDQSPFLAGATPSTAFRIQHPATEDITAMDRVVVRPETGLNIKRMYVFLNGMLLYERDRAPWEVITDEQDYSLSGKNTLTVLLDTDRGLLKTEKEMKPLRVAERISTRLVQVTFNAFNEELEFVNDVEFDKLKVTVDGQDVQPKNIQKLDEPITYCFLVDNSFSMQESFDGNIAAVRQYLDAMRPQDRGYFVSFSDHYTQLCQPNSSKAVLKAVAGNIALQRPNANYADKLYRENNTFLYDAMIAAIHTLQQYSGRKIIIAVTDGIGTEGQYKLNGMLSYARENEVVIYSLWLDNNPTLSDAEEDTLRKERTRGEKFLRKIGLGRIYKDKDARHNYIASKVRNASITQGILKILAEESGGFHYRIFRSDRSLIQDYARDIEQAVASQFAMSLNLPVALKEQHVEITSGQAGLDFRNKSEVKVRKTNPFEE